MIGRRYSLRHTKLWIDVRCRLISSWGWRRSQGSGCSPVKEVRELGSERKLHCALLSQDSNVSVYIAPRIQILTKIGETRLGYRTIQGVIPRVSTSVMLV